MRLGLGFLLALSTLMLTVSCAGEPTQRTVDSATQSILERVDQPPLIHYFTTSADGEHSVLWRAALGAPSSPTETVARSRLQLVTHVAGYAPRGAISQSGRMAWLNLPANRRHGDSAQLWLGGEIVDERALYLQTPMFLGEDLYYLRRSPGPARVGPDGKLLQTLDDFELVRLAPSGAERIVHTESALWFHFVGQSPAADARLLVLRVRDDGTDLLEFARDGELLTTHFLGTGSVRDVRVNPAQKGRVTYLRSAGGPAGAQVRELALAGRPSPASGRRRAKVLRANLHSYASPLPLRSGALLLAEGDPFSEPFFAVPLDEVSAGVVLWREDRENQLTYVLRGPGDRVRRLAPPGDAAQDVSLLRAGL